MFIIRWYRLSSFRERNCRNLFYKLVTEDMEEFLPEIRRGRGMERERDGFLTAECVSGRCMRGRTIHVPREMSCSLLV